VSHCLVVVRRLYLVNTMRLTAFHARRAWTGENSGARDHRARACDCDRPRGLGLDARRTRAQLLRGAKRGGIGTLTIDMWTPRGIPSGSAAFGGNGGYYRRPRSVRDTLPDAFGALEYLAPCRHRSRKIGIMGFC